MSKQAFVAMAREDQEEMIARARSSASLDQYDAELARIGHGEDGRMRTRVAIRRAELAKKPVPKAVRERAAAINLAELLPPDEE